MFSRNLMKKMAVAVVVMFALFMTVLPLIAMQQRSSGLVSWSRQATALRTTSASNFQCQAAVCPAGFYLLTYEAHVVTAQTGSFQELFTWNNGAAQSLASSILNLNTTGAYVQASVPLMLDGSTNFTTANSISTGAGTTSNVLVTVGLTRIR